MSIAELIPAVQALPRVDKLKLMQLIAEDLAKEGDGATGFPCIAEIWSPYDSFEAAATLKQMLDEDKAAP